MQSDTPNSTATGFLARWVPWLALWLLLVPGGAGAADLGLSIADISSGGMAARGVRLVLRGEGRAEVGLDELRLGTQVWRKLRLRCEHLEWRDRVIACNRGYGLATTVMPLTFQYDLLRKHLDLTLGTGRERWQVSGDFAATGWKMAVQWRHAQASRLAGWLPAGVPQPVQGELDGTLQFAGGTAGMETLTMDVRLAKLAFSDAAGLHAAEGVGGRLQLTARRYGERWDWRGSLDWQQGELFWQPFYLRAGLGLRAEGQIRGDQLELRRAELEQAGVGRAELSLVWDFRQSALEQCRFQGRHLALAPWFATWGKPLLDKGVLAEAELSGHAEVDWRYRAGRTESLLLRLHEAGITDGQHRYALRGVNGDIPWQREAASEAVLSWSGGELLHLPLGATQLRVAMKGLEFSLPEAILPILDGRLALRDFHLHHEHGDWHWNVAGHLSPVAMRSLTRAVGLPEMHGTLSGVIPQVTYAGGIMQVDGALLFRVFDGTIVANRLQLAEPFGRAPRLSGHLVMRGLDLDLLTRTFSFGNMQGRLDISVNDLELANWQPVRFDARVSSSPGDYRKKISQKAVENISSLGGSGAAVALQRSYLRFFENFGYERIGLSCVLRAGVCEMGGVGHGNGAYVIVEGGGIPAITVMGYNRAVGWDELLARLRHVMQNNVQAVVE